jgi:hypothetical protein
LLAGVQCPGVQIVVAVRHGHGCLGLRPRVTSHGAPILGFSSTVTPISREDSLKSL